MSKKEKLLVIAIIVGVVLAVAYTWFANNRNKRNYKEGVISVYSAYDVITSDQESEYEADTYDLNKDYVAQIYYDDSDYDESLEEDDDSDYILVDNVSTDNSSDDIVDKLMSDENFSGVSRYEIKSFIDSAEYIYCSLSDAIDAECIDVNVIADGIFAISFSVNNEPNLSDTLILDTVANDYYIGSYKAQDNISKEEVGGTEQ